LGGAAAFVTLVTLPLVGVAPVAGSGAEVGGADAGGTPPGWAGCAGGPVEVAWVGSVGPAWALATLTDLPVLARPVLAGPVLGLPVLAGPVLALGVLAFAVRLALGSRGGADTVVVVPAEAAGLAMLARAALLVDVLLVAPLVVALLVELLRVVAVLFVAALSVAALSVAVLAVALFIVAVLAALAVVTLVVAAFVVVALATLVPPLSAVLSAASGFAVDFPAADLAVAGWAAGPFAVLLRAGDTWVGLASAGSVDVPAAAFFAPRGALGFDVADAVTRAPALSVV
jgi:hypothetical protein